MDEAIRKAAVLVEAMGWIRRFRGSYVVIKLGGSALEETEAVDSCLKDVIFLETVGMRPVLVHGGGKAISQAMSSAGITPRFVHGRRFTDDATMGIVASTLADKICSDLVARIDLQGGRAEGLNFLTHNCLTASRLILSNEQGEPLDLGLVGEVNGVDRTLLDDRTGRGIIPVIPSVALDESGQCLNVNADTAAAAVARELKAEKLVFLSDVPGILRNRDDVGSLISHLDADGCRRLIADGTIDSGMVPKVDAAMEALTAGVNKVHLVDARMPHSILLEIYSNRGIGTEIV